MSYRKLAEELAATLAKDNPGATFDVILIGSVARGVETPRSDVDVLVITDEDLAYPRVEHPIHLQVFDVETFLRRLRHGDDFACWCIRYGISLSDSGVWKKIVASPDAEVWPDWKTKVAQATRRLILASRLLQTDDLYAAAEETLYAVAHTARAILLQRGTFPLARPEIVGQLTQEGQTKLAGVLSSLLRGEPHDSLYLWQVHGLVKKLLIHLDAATYKDTALKHSKAVRAKEPGLRRTSTPRTGGLKS